MWQIWAFAVGLVLLPVACFISRFWQILSNRQCRFDPQKKVSTMVVLGSGGHTAEMLKLMDGLDKRAYSPRCYVIAASDGLSGKKALAKEREWNAGQDPSDISVEVIPRSREVGQSYITSVFTTIYASMSAAYLVWRRRPALVLVNGPGTCLPICMAAFLFRLVRVMETRIVYVESIARVDKLSLTGRILYDSKVADLLLVQWEKLHAKYPQSVYPGSRLY